MKSDTYHNFPDMVDNYANEGHKFTLIGGDGKQRELYQVEGSLNGKNGVFEWIYEPGKGTTHRRFIANGKITGTPNQIPEKGN